MAWQMPIDVRTPQIPAPLGSCGSLNSGKSINGSIGIFQGIRASENVEFHFRLPKSRTAWGIEIRIKALSNARHTLAAASVPTGTVDPWILVSEVRNFAR
jgi:hypothetical protein